MTTQAELQDPQGWEDYWKTQKKGRFLYNVIAEFYRRFIIRPSLSRAIKNNFPRGANLLHAGCGSGQVDSDIRKYVSITGLDISKNALAIYTKENGSSAQVLHGSIFAIPLEPNTQDGIYNLGVMEHFEKNEITLILKEFYRVLKPKGKLVIFWPPEFGLSVLFFKALRLTLKALTRKNFKFHPDEISRVKSKQEAKGYFTAAGFNVLSYSFGPRDMFTYSIIVAEKS